MSTGGATAERRRRIATRAAPLIVVATLAFAGGMVIAVEPDAPAAQRFVDAWERGDIAAMYAELTPDAQEEFSLPHFRQIYDDAATQSTLAELSAGDVSEQGDDAVIPVSMRTHLFGDPRRQPQAAAERRQGRLGPEPRLPGPGAG